MDHINNISLPLISSVRWLRFRVIAQGFTVVAAVLGGYKLAQERKEARRVSVASDNDASAALSASSEAKEEDKEAERRRFEARLKEAEEVHRLEVQAEESAKKMSKNKN